MNNFKYTLVGILFMILIVIGVILILIIIFLVFLIISIYNRFQKLANGADAGLAQIKVALKKRLDMITQLVDVVKSFAKFEREVMTSITKMRSLVMETKATKEIDNVNSGSKKIFDNILAVVEQYPNLKTSENVNDLMNAIEEVEDEILRQRYTYNNIVQEYNTRLFSFPSNIVAKIFSYKKLEYLKFEEKISIKPDTKWNK